MKYGKLVIIAMIGALSLGMINGCSMMRNMAIEDSVKDVKGGQDSKKVEAFEDKFSVVLDDISNKDDYKKVPLSGSGDTDWFIKQSFTLWDKQQSKEQYISNGEKKFPGYKKTFEYLADEFTK